MSLSRVATRSRIGLTAVPVHVELHLSPGLPVIAMVGMPESVMREAKERVRSAVISSGFRWDINSRARFFCKCVIYTNK